MKGRVAVVAGRGALVRGEECVRGGNLQMVQDEKLRNPFKEILRQYNNIFKEKLRILKKYSPDGCRDFAVSRAERWKK